MTMRLMTFPSGDRDWSHMAAIVKLMQRDSCVVFRGQLLGGSTAMGDINAVSGAWHETVAGELY